MKKRKRYIGRYPKNKTAQKSHPKKQPLHPKKNLSIRIKKRESTRKIAGITLIILGIFLILIKPVGNMTGAVISTQNQNYISLLGVLITMIGIVLILVHQGVRVVEDVPSDLEDIVRVSSLPKTPHLEVLPDTNFLINLEDHSGGRRSRINLSGYQLVLLPEIIRECKHKGLASYIGNYLQSRHVILRRETEDAKIGPYRQLLRNAWQRACMDQNKPEKLKEFENLYREKADPSLLVYAIQRGNRPTLIVSDDAHLKFIAPALRKMTGANLDVQGIDDYYAWLKKQQQQHYQQPPQQQKHPQQYPQNYQQPQRARYHQAAN